MKKGLGLILLCFMLVTFIGCDNQDGKGVDHVYAATVKWNDTNYTLTNTVVAQEDMDEQINTIKKVVKKFPKENCEVNASILVGAKLYRLKNEKITDAIAVECNGKYLKAVISKLLKNYR